MYIRDFKHMWYQINEADYCLKHFKLVFFSFHNICFPRVSKMRVK